MTKAKDFAADGFRSLNNAPLTVLPAKEVSKTVDFAKKGVRSFTKGMNILAENTAFPKTAAFEPTRSFCATLEFANVRQGAEVEGPKVVKNPEFAFVNNPKLNERAS